MIDIAYVLCGVLTGASIIFILLKSRMKSDFQSRQAEIEKDYVTIKERLNAREVEVDGLKDVAISPLVESELEMRFIAYRDFLKNVKNWVFFPERF